MDCVKNGNTTIKEDSTESSCSTCKCNDYDNDADLAFYDANNNFGGSKTCDNQLFKNIKLSDLADQFESVLQRVKELELDHLVEPIEAAASKLRQLQEVTEKYSCNYYENCLCADKTCYKQNYLNREASCDSCVCRTGDGGTLCHCGSASRPDITSALNKFDLATKPKKDAPKRGPSKCNPCVCTKDSTTGKRFKSANCRSRRHDNEAECVQARPKTAEPLVPSTAVLREAKLSNTRLAVRTNLRDWSVSLSKTNAVVEDTYVKVQDVNNQATYCDWSSSSSSDEYESEMSDEWYEGPHSKSSCSNYSECLRGKRRHSKTDSHDGSCSCGHNSAVGEPEFCPCGCGDAVELPSLVACRRRSHCQCDNCGKELDEGPKRREAIGELPEKTRSGSEKIHSRKEKSQDVNVYIEDLETECREKDKIIKSLKQELGRSDTAGCCKDQEQPCLPSYIA